MRINKEECPSQQYSKESLYPSYMHQMNWNKISILQLLEQNITKECEQGSKSALILISLQSTSHLHNLQTPATDSISLKADIIKKYVNDSVKGKKMSGQGKAHYIYFMGFKLNH